MSRRTNFCPSPQILRPGGSPEGFQGYPVSFCFQVTIRPGEPAALPPEAFTNQTAYPIDIYSMRWIIDAPATSNLVNAADGFGPVIAGAGIRCTIEVNSIPVTGQFIPLYLLGKAESQIAEQQIIGTTVGGDPSGLYDDGSACAGQWILDYPMTIEPGESIHIRLQHTNLVGRALTVTIVMAGRGGVASQSRRRRLPYVSAWMPSPLIPSQATATAPIIVTSTPRDLVNKSGGEIQVRRFLGRMLRTFPSDAANLSFDAVFPPQTLNLPLTDTTIPFDAFLTVVANDSRGNSVIAPSIETQLGAPFRLVFEPTTRAWECPHKLDPDDYYLFQLTLSNSGADAEFLGTSLQPAIAMIGYQEVA